MSDETIVIGRTGVRLSNNDIVVECQADPYDNFFISIDEWVELKDVVDKMISNRKSKSVDDETNPTATCRKVPSIHGQES